MPQHHFFIGRWCFGMGFHWRYFVAGVTMEPAMFALHLGHITLSVMMFPPEFIKS